MKLKVFIALAAIALVAAGGYWLRKSHARLPVLVTIRVAVAPDNRVEYVTGQANSAKFKYLMGRQSGVKPVRDSKLLEAQVSVANREVVTRYAAIFADSLQYVCGQDSHITLAGKSIE